MAMLIGREQPAAVLRGEVERALSTHGALVLVTGEPGIGKSTLVASAVEEAVHGGARLLTGACWEGEGAPGYWPWVQVLRQLAPDTTPQDLAGPDGEAFQLYDAVTALLVEASREQPVVVVLEDLHWADAASLRLLEFVVGHAWFERLLVIGTYRDAEVDGPLSLPLEAKATTLALTGLDHEEVGRLVARTTGVSPGEELISEIHQRTGGNPFFVEQTARLWQGGSPLATIPPGVDAAIRRRLSRLPDGTREVLRMAAVLGRKFTDQSLATALTSLTDPLPALPTSPQVPLTPPPPIPQSTLPAGVPAAPLTSPTDSVTAPPTSPTDSVATAPTSLTAIPAAPPTPPGDSVAVPSDSLTAILSPVTQDVLQQGQIGTTPATAPAAQAEAAPVPAAPTELTPVPPVGAPSGPAPVSPTMAPATPSSVPPAPTPARSSAVPSAAEPAWPSTVQSATSPASPSTVTPAARPAPPSTITAPTGAGAPHTITGFSNGAVRRALDQAVSAKLVTSLGSGRYAFVHDLVRETLYAELDAAGACARHAAALRALEPALPAIRAHHAYLAAVPDAPDLLLAAAKDAEARLAEEEAVGHYRHALELTPTSDPRRRATIALDLGVAQHRAGDTAAGVRTLDAAIAITRRLDAPDLLAITALKLHELCYDGQGRWTDFVHEAHHHLTHLAPRLSPTDPSVRTHPTGHRTGRIRPSGPTHPTSATHPSGSIGPTGSTAANHSHLNKAATVPAALADHPHGASLTPAPNCSHPQDPATNPGPPDDHPHDPAANAGLPDDHFHNPATDPGPLDNRLHSSATNPEPPDNRLHNSATDLRPTGIHEGKPVSAPTPPDHRLNEATSVSLPSRNPLDDPTAAHTPNHQHLEDLAVVPVPGSDHLGDPGTLPAPDQGYPQEADDDGERLEVAARELSAVAAELARRGADDEALGFSLLARLGVIWGPGTTVERLAITEELLAVARRTRDTQLELTARSWRVGALLELGDPRCLSEQRTFVGRAEGSELALFQHEATVLKAMFTTFTGRFDEVDAHIDAAYELGRQPGIGRRELRWMQRWSAAMVRGRLDVADDVLAEVERAGLHFPLHRAVTEVQRGGGSEAAMRHLAEIMATGEQYLRWMAPLWLRFQAQAAALSKDPVLCEHARAAIAPYVGQWGLTATVAVEGPFAHWAAVLDAAQERWDAAIDGFTSAYRAADLLGARPWSIESRARLAEVLQARGDDASALIEQVERDAADLGMRVRLPRPGANAFRFDGEVWTLTFAGRTVHLPDSKGLADLRVLIGRPGSDVSAVELLNPSGGEVVVAARSMGGDDVLDDEARRRYRRRLELLDDEIDRAAELGDDRRAATLDAERQALLDELRAAAGLGGRPRRLGDEAERARKAVTNRIRNTLRQLDQRHPELATHLRTSVSTGATCRYQPTPEVRWSP